MMDVKPYVLRYWETEFTQLRPTKNRAGNRTYRDSDIELLFRIKELLYDEKYTIEGARQQLSEPQDSDGVDSRQSLKRDMEKIKLELREILELLDEEKD